MPYVNSVVSPIEISKKLRHIIPEGFNTAADGLRIRENNKEKIKLIPNDKNVVLVKTKVEHIHWRDFPHIQRCIEKGYEAVNCSMLDKIRNIPYF